MTDVAPLMKMLYAFAVLTRDGPPPHVDQLPIIYNRLGFDVSESKWFDVLKQQGNLSVKEGNILATDSGLNAARALEGYVSQEYRERVTALGRELIKEKHSK